MDIGPIDTCQICGARDLRSVLFLGYLPPVNQMRPVTAPADAETWFPAELMSCSHCHLAQLGYSADPAILFPPEYPYTSGSTRVLRDNFADLYETLRSQYGLAEGDLVVDIGSNDGTLLSNFAAGGVRVLGVEPTDTGALALERGIPTMQAFFDGGVAEEIVAEQGVARVVTAANVFAHIPRVHDVVTAIESLLAPDGIFVSESHYLGDLVETLQYDTIYHEHLRYYSLTSLEALLRQHGFSVVHVQRIPTHGGSIRVFATRGVARVDPSVSELREEEDRRGLTSGAWEAPFRERVVESKLKLYELLAPIRARGDAVYGIGAPSRASTLATYVGLDDGTVDCVLEISTSKKLNKYLPGTNVPVLDEQKLYDDQPPYALLLSWHIADELIDNLRGKGFRGDFIVPLPEPHVVTG